MRHEYIQSGFPARSGLGMSGGLTTPPCRAGTGTRREASLASRTVAPESGGPEMMSAIYGLSVRECYASYDRASRSLKTLQGCLLQTEEDFSMEFCGTFTKAGMLRNGRLYRLSTPERRTCESGHGLWPTPKATGGNGAGIHGEGGLDLQTAAALWPTPGVGGYGGTSGRYATLKRNCADMNEVRKMGAGNYGQLNANWVERLMGSPDNWTDIEIEDVARESRYPAAWADGSWDTIPRVVSGQKHRRGRIKALGNSIVPQVAALLLARIKNYMEETNNG